MDTKVVHVSPALHRRLKLRAARIDQPLARVVEQALAEFLARAAKRNGRAADDDADEVSCRT